MLLKTMSSVSQAEGALRAAVKTGLPVWLAVTVDDFDGKSTRSGEDLNSLRPLLESFEPEALLINCSRPEAVSVAVEVIRSFGFPLEHNTKRFSKKFLEISWRQAHRR